MLSPLYCITDADGIDACILDRVCGAVRGGVGLVQVREKGATDRAVVGLAKRLLLLLEETDAILLINDRVDIALAVGARGVHLSSEASIPPTQARKALGAGAIIGVSTHNLEEIDRAETEGADFITFGPVFDTPSKREYGEPKGLKALAEAVKRTYLPLYALGGVTNPSLAQIAPTGAYGVASIRGLLDTSEPEEVAQQWHETWEAACGR